MKDGGEVARKSMPYASSTRSHSASSPRAASPRSTARPPQAAEAVAAVVAVEAVAAAGLPSPSSLSSASRSKDHVGVGGPPRGDRAGPSGRPRPRPLAQRRARHRLPANDAITSKPNLKNIDHGTPETSASCAVMTSLAEAPKTLSELEAVVADLEKLLSDATTDVGR